MWRSLSLLLLVVSVFRANGQICLLSGGLTGDCQMTPDCLGVHCSTTVLGVTLIADLHFQACTLPNTVDVRLQVGTVVLQQAYPVNAQAQFVIDTPFGVTFLGQSANLQLIIKNIGFPEPTRFHADLALKVCYNTVLGSSCDAVPGVPDPVYSFNFEAGQDPCRSADAAAVNGTWAGVGSGLGVLGMGAILLCCVRRRKQVKNGTVPAEPPLCGRSLRPQWALASLLFLMLFIASVWYVYPFEVARQAGTPGSTYSGKDIYNALIVAMVFWSVCVGVTLFWTRSYRLSENAWVLLLRFLVWLCAVFVFFVSLTVACLWGAGKINDLTLSDHTQNVAILSWVCTCGMLLHHLVTLATDDTRVDFSRVTQRCPCACCQRGGGHGGGSVEGGGSSRGSSHYVGSKDSLNSTSPKQLRSMPI